MGNNNPALASGGESSLAGYTAIPGNRNGSPVRHFCLPTFHSLNEASIGFFMRSGFSI
jgi:hypothetical protein